MPSPSIVSPSSNPNISKTRYSRSPKAVVPPLPSNRSSCSADSRKPAWPKTVGSFIARKGNPSSKKSEWTQKSLEEFNIINEIFYDHNKKSGYSPYYRGLTDSSLALRERVPGPDLSPARESDESSSSRSSFALKMQEFGSCFLSLGKEEKAMEVENRRSGGARRLSSSSLSILKERENMKTLAMELGMQGEFVSIGLKGKNEILLVKGKPLRERDLEPPPRGSPQPPQPHSSPPTSLIPPVSPPTESHPSSPQSSLRSMSPPPREYRLSPPPQPYPLPPQWSLAPLSSPPPTPTIFSPLPSTSSLIPPMSPPPQEHPSPPPALPPPLKSPPHAQPSPQPASPSPAPQLSPQKSPPHAQPSPQPASPTPALQLSPQQSLPSPISSPPVLPQTSPLPSPPPLSLPQLSQTSPQLERPPPSPPPQAAQTSPANRTTKNADTSKTTNDSVYNWADDYRPETLKDFICNRNKALELENLVKDGDCGSHFIFEGPPGVGKRTMIRALLREAYGPDRTQAREVSKEFSLTGEAIGSIEVTVKISLQHVEVNLSEVKGYEKHVIVELIQETIKRLSKKALHCNKDNCQVIILHEADKLSADALLYIKWQLGSQRGCCGKVFFCCTDASKLQPIIPLCTVVKLLPPSSEEIVEVLEFIAKQEGIELPHKLAEKIANHSKNNLRQAIRSFKATWQANSPLKEDQVILTGWEDDIAKIAKNIVEEQSPKQLYVIRGELQKLIEHSVCPEFIFKALMGELKKHLDEEFQTQVDSLYEDYKNLARNRPCPNTLKRQNDPVKKNLHHFMRIEEFIAKFMSSYKMSIVKRKACDSKGAL